MRGKFICCLLVFVFPAVMFMGGCRKEIIEEKETQDSAYNITLPTQIAPDKCRITGTIKKIFPADEKSPCGNAPCLASVLVENIHGYGHSFKNPLKTGKEILVKFEFTLLPASKNLFANLDKRLPGLSLESAFTGDIESIDQPGMAESAGLPVYRVFLYKKHQ